MPCEFLGISALAFQTDSKCFQTAQNLVRIPNTQHPANQLHHADKRGAVELIACNNNAAHRVAVPAQKLRRTVNYHVSAVFEWLTQIRRCKGVIDDEPRANLVSDLCTRFKIADLQKRI